MQPEQQVSASLDRLGLVQAQLLEPAELDLSDIDRALGALMSRRLDYADIYFQLTRFETWTVEDGIVKDGVHSVDHGVGVRAVAGEKTGFAYSDELDKRALNDAVEAARGIARDQGTGRYKVAAQAAGREFYPAVDPLVSLEDADKVRLLSQLDREVRAMDERIIQVIGSLAGVYEIVLVQTSDGVLGVDVRPLVRLNVSIIMESNGHCSPSSSAKSGQWASDIPGAPEDFHTLEEKTVGIVGLGRIGRAVAKRLHGWECEIVYTDVVDIPKEVEQQLHASRLPLDELLAASDVVTLHIPLERTTYHMIGERELGLMKKTAILINACRGPVVDEAALIKALQDGRIAGASLDVLEEEPARPDNPLLSMKNVIVTPHSASRAIESMLTSTKFAIENVSRLARGEEPESLVPPV